MRASGARSAPQARRGERSLRNCRRRDSPSMRIQTAAPRTESITTNLRMSESHRDECSVLWKTRRVGLTSGSAEGPRLLPSDRG